MKRMMVLVVAVLAGAAAAQDAVPKYPALNLDREALNVTGNGSLLIGNGELVPAGTLRAMVGVEYASKLAITRRLADRDDTELTDRMYAQIGAAYGITKQWDAAVYVPIMLAQERGYSGTTLGSPVFSVRAGIPDGMYDFVPLNVSFELGAMFEFGTPLQDWAALTTTREPRPHPIIRLNVGKSFGPVNVFGEVGFIERTDSGLHSVRGLEEDVVTDQLRTSLGLSAQIWEGLSFDLSAANEYDLKASGFTFQFFASARYAASGYTGFVGFGPAFGDLIGTPDWRLIGGVSGAFEGLTLPAAK